MDDFATKVGTEHNKLAKHVEDSGLAIQTEMREQAQRNDSKFDEIIRLLAKRDAPGKDGKGPATKPRVQ
eukprot:4501170-Heterocapsa_arctica.AAC.1